MKKQSPTSCFGLSKSYYLDELPFPQNKKVEICYSTGSRKHKTTHRHPVCLIPILEKPLSANRYYVLESRGSNKGKAFTSSKEEDAVTCCFCKCFSDIEPIPADHHDTYQQFEICRGSWGSFVAKSVVPDGVPPEFLRIKGWEAAFSTPRNFILREAPGLDPALRARLAEFNFPLSCKTSETVVVEKWYCPFIFVKDGTPKDQMAKSMYYQMTLEQRWEQIFACDRSHNEDNVVVVDVEVEREMFKVGAIQEQALRNEIIVVDGFMRFRSTSNMEGEAIDIGLSLVIVKRMRWEQERFGWRSKEERQKRIKKSEEFESGKVWSKFGCYVLVERFALRKMDGSLALTYDFKFGC